MTDPIIPDDPNPELDGGTDAVPDDEGPGVPDPAVPGEDDADIQDEPVVENQP